MGKCDEAKCGVRPGRLRLRLLLTPLLASVLVAACGSTAAKPPPAAPPISVSAIVHMKPGATSVTLLPGTPPHLASLHFVNAQDGWSGGQGVILATNDGGATWQPQYLGKANVTGFSFLSPTLGYAATSAGLLQTTDGKTWHSVSSQSLDTVQFLSASQGYALGGPSTQYSSYSLLATTDGGQSWNTLPIGPVQQACFFSATDGIAVPQTAYGGTLTLERTVDGGAQWKPELTVKNGFPAQFACTPDGSAWLVADGGSGMSQTSYSVFRSGDQGLTWSAVLAVSTAGAGPAPGNTQGATPGPGSSPGPIAVTDRENAIMVGVCEACGGSGTASLDHTSDGGRTWQIASRPIPAPSAFGLVLDMLTPQDGWLLSNAGLAAQSEIQGTTDGGATWHTLLTAGAPTPTTAIAFINAKLGYGIGRTADPLAVVRTEDGGKSWQTVGHLPAGTSPYGYSAMAAFSAGDLYYASNGVLLASRDGGKQWVVNQALPQPVSAISFIGSKTGCASVGIVRGGLDYVTRDGGKTWHRGFLQGVPAPVCAVSLTDPALAKQAVQIIQRLAPTPGKGTALPKYSLSTLAAGGGALWIALSDPPQSRLYVLSPGKPPTVHRWPDNQLNFMEMSPVNGAESFAVTSDGRLLSTTDGGAHWKQIP